MKKFKMGLDLYYISGSAPCRNVLMTAKAVGVELNLKVTDLMAGDHLKPEFVAINPQHTLPTLVDDGFALWESRAIMVYLVEKYGKTSTLYPSDPKARAQINQRLYFDMGTLYDRFSNYFYPPIFENEPVDPEKLTKLEEALGWLNTYLEGQKYAAGDNLTLADISLVSTVSTIELDKTVDLSKHPNVVAWFERCKATVPGYDLNESGLAEFKAKCLS